MATTLEGLQSYYANIMRVNAAAVPAPDQALLTSLAGQVDAGQLVLGAAQQQVAKLAANTTSVANLAYNFFTGATPTSAGLDYLVSPTGGNTANLNAAYYQSFSLENRYINFAVNLGKVGEGKVAFAGGYAGLTLAQSVSKAYAEIFGTLPDQAKVDAILNAQVPNGVGGTYSRASYFASYGLDGANGIGTKAAMVGWLLTEAVKADIGSYALANDAFLADLGPDGTAIFRAPLVASYAMTSGAVLAFAPDQSVSPLATAANLRATDSDDTVTGAGLSAGQSISTAGGKDSVNATGTINGLIDTGAGDDQVTVKLLAPSTGLVNSTQTGTIRLGAGNDTLVVTDHMEWESVVDGGEGDDTLIASFANLTIPITGSVTVQNIEHLVITATDPRYGIVFAPPGVKDITSRVGDLQVSNIADGVALQLQGVNSGSFGAVYQVTSTRVVVDGQIRTVVLTPDLARLSLDQVSVAPGASTNVTINFPKAVYVNVVSDSVLTNLRNQGPGPEPSTLFIQGPGRLTTAIGPTNNLDAGQSAGVDITRFGGAGDHSATLSAFGDKIALDTSAASQGNVTLILGGGVDQVSLYQAGDFANLAVVEGTVSGYARVMDLTKGVDRLDLGAMVPSLTTGLTQFIGAATTLSQAVSNVSAQLAANATGVFEYAGDTYIYHQNATAGVNTGDGLIQLLGVTGLTMGTGAASVDIHYG